MVFTTYACMYKLTTWGGAISQVDCGFATLESRVPVYILCDRRSTLANQSYASHTNMFFRWRIHFPLYDPLPGTNCSITFLTLYRLIAKTFHCTSLWHARYPTIASTALVEVDTAHIPHFASKILPDSLNHSWSLAELLTPMHDRASHRSFCDPCVYSRTVQLSVSALRRFLLTLPCVRMLAFSLLCFLICTCFVELVKSCTFLVQMIWLEMTINSCAICLLPFSFCRSFLYSKWVILTGLVPKNHTCHIWCVKIKCDI